MLQTEVKKPLRSATYAAQRLGATEWQVYAWAKRKVIPSVRVGRRVKFDEDALERFIANGGAGLPEDSK